MTGTRSDAGVVRVQEIMSAAWLASAVSVLADLGVPDHFGDTPLAVGELATAVGAEPGALLQFLRAGVAADLFTEEPGHRFALTDAGRVLRSDAPSSMREMCRVVGRPEFQLTWAHAAHTARTGEPAFAVPHGKPLFDYMFDNPAFAAEFHGAMAQSTSASTVDASFDFSTVGHVVDLGGGNGSMLAALLSKHPHLRGTLVDLPHAVAEAPAVLEAAGVADRVEIRAGSFFDGVPEGGDVYVLSRVIGNWNDADCVKILSNVRAALTPAARLLIVGHMPTAADRTHYLPALGLFMYVLLQSNARTVEDHDPLFAEAGLTAAGFHNVPDSESVLQARLP
ncbi:methyltransferase [Amycolatopsis sp. cg5]|uniref:methyltransferase n=1 Tax=Amycolatopsis sp. cg5 TaxID=3238802 RepID=UPI003523B59B